MKEYLLIAAFFVGLTVVSIWFALGYLTPFLNNTFAIIGCALRVMVIPIGRLLKFMYAILEREIIKPIQRFVKPIHVPRIVKVILYMCFGVGVFILDHFYATKIYDADQTIFYKISFQGQTYWITQQGMTIGGFFVGLAVLLFILEILRVINWILDRKFQISIVFQR